MFRADHPCLPPLEPFRPLYENRPMRRSEAVDLLTDVGVLVSEWTRDGRPIAHTARIAFEPAGAGYDAVMPVELLEPLMARAYALGFEDARRGR